MTWKQMWDHPTFVIILKYHILSYVKLSIKIILGFNTYRSYLMGSYICEIIGPSKIIKFSILRMIFN